MANFVKNFFYSFLPKLLKGNRNDEVYSMTRFGMLGCLTAAVAFSNPAIAAFIYYKKFDYLLYLVFAWLASAVLLSVFLAIGRKARDKMAENVLQIIGDKLNSNNNDKSNN